MSLTSEQRAVLRNLGGWSIADALLGPERGAAALRSSMWGGTYSHDGLHAWFQCEKRGIVVRDRLADGPDLLLVRWSEIARYAATMPASVRDELRAARDHHRAVNVAYACRHDHFPPGATRPPFNQGEFDAHMAEWLPAVERLTAALNAALADPVSAPEQLDMFAGVA